MAAPDPHDGSKRRSSFAEEWRVLRAVARADGSVGRILDGHFNGVERLSVLAPDRCAPGNSRPSPPGASGSGSGVPIPYPGRDTGPARQDQWALLTGRRQDVLQRRDGTRPRARGRTRAGGGAGGFPAARIR